MPDLLLILAAALVLDALLGDPVYPFHPVRLMGRSVVALENGLRRIGWSGRGGGAVLLIAALALWGGTGYLLMAGLGRLGRIPAGLGGVFLLYSCLSLKDLCDHAGPVARALAGKDLERARASVQRIVGRDAKLLDEEGVARAAVESVAEGFVDGYLSTLFWFATGSVTAFLAGGDGAAAGVAAGLGHRIVNTLDSMVGYRNERYQRFGTAAARCDDLLNFIPARLAIPILTLAALVTGADPQACWRIGVRDRLKHDSPNAGHAESCAAGALGLRLGGPTIYPHGTVAKPWLGDGPAMADAGQIERCCGLIRAGGVIAGLLFLGTLGILTLTGE